MKTIAHLLTVLALLLAATTTDAKPPKHGRTRAYYARQYRKVCEARASRKPWPRHAPARY